MFAHSWPRSRIFGNRFISQEIIVSSKIMIPRSKRIGEINNLKLVSVLFFVSLGSLAKLSFLGKNTFSHIFQLIIITGKSLRAH